VNDLNSVAMGLLHEMARVIQLGGETLFVRFDGSTLERPDQSSKGWPDEIVVRGGRESVTYGHKSVAFKDEQVHFYVETGSEFRYSESEPSIVLDTTGAYGVMRFNDGSTLTGPMIRAITQEGNLVMESFYHASGGLAEKWGSLFAQRVGGESELIGAGTLENMEDFDS
jgi:hypothetical protein